MALIYANENFFQPVVEALRQLGDDVLTTLEAGKAGQSITDEEVLAFAREHGRILITFNRKHFIRLHQQSSDHAGIIVCTIDPDAVQLARRIHDVIIATPNMDGQLIRVNRPHPSELKQDE